MKVPDSYVINRKDIANVKPGTVIEYGGELCIVTNRICRKEGEEKITSNDSCSWTTYKDPPKIMYRCVYLSDGHEVSIPRGTSVKVYPKAEINLNIGK